jgi:excisionase family DNA binding protein
MASKNPKAGGRLLTAKEVEDWLQIKRKTVYAYAQKNLIPHVRLEGNIRFPARELQHWVARNSHLPRKMRTRRIGQPRAKRKPLVRAH